ncbi:MAG: biotin--[acetyl-CoA-carboxylase] ligase, partial [Propionibacteriaceae bacterium]|nr:biotin--[acetyl-CoA-carboxylase] ligase [Propionibacteriaceae bacterium]
LGFGINVSMDRNELPIPSATSLLLEGSLVDKTALMVEVLRGLAGAYALWRDAPGDLAADYAERCITIGREVRVQLATGQVVGTAVGVDASGGLRLATASGERVFTAGDVIHLRPLSGPAPRAQ